MTIHLIGGSSQEAMTMAIDSFRTQIKSNGTPVQDFVLKLGMKSLSGEITWAPLRAEQWADIVSNGDEIRVGGSGVPEADGPGPVIVFGLIEGYSGSHFPTTSKHITVVLPKTREVNYIQKQRKRKIRLIFIPKDLKKLIRSEFSLNSPFHLIVHIGSDGHIKTTIPYPMWLSVMRQMVKKQPLCQIFVERASSYDN